MDFGDECEYPYNGNLLNVDCETELSGAAAAASPAVWLVVVKQEAHYLSKIVCALRTKAAAVARAAAHEAANEDDRGATFVTGYRVETGAAPAIFVASTVIQVGHMIDAVTEVKATAMAAKQASELEAAMHGAGEDCDCVVARYAVSDE
jgi:hypothetical protein